MLALLPLASLSAWSQETDSWQISMAIGFNKTDGNSDTLLLNSSLTAEKEMEKNIYRFGIEGAYGETKVEQEDGSTEDTATAQNAKGFAHYKRTHERSYVYLDSSVLHDDIAEVDYRALMGPGAGYFLIKSEVATLGIEAGPTYLWEKVGGQEDDYPVLRFAQRYDWQISETAKLWQAVEYLPRIDDSEDYLLNAEIGAEAALNTHLSLRVVVQERYDNTPAEGQERSDLTMIVALALHL